MNATTNDRAPLTEVRAYYATLQRLGKFTGTIAAAVRKRKARIGGRVVEIIPTQTQRKIAAKRLAIFRLASGIAVPPGDEQMHTVLIAIQRANPRLRNWSGGINWCTHSWIGGREYKIFESGSNSDWKKRSTFSRGVEIASTAKGTWREIEYRCCGGSVKVPAPRGYRWDVDNLGLKLVGKAGEYHPNGDELIAAANDKCREIVIRLKNSARTRRELERETKAKAKQQQRMLRLAEREGARVCLADSIRAGNCHAGTLNWAQSHGFDSRRHYRPSEVLAKANGDMKRVAIVVAAAVRRHRAEMDRGYALLTDHRA
mgnify:FL=1